MHLPAQGIGKAAYRDGPPSRRRPGHTGVDRDRAGLGLRRPWRRLEWRRIVDFYHACGYVQQLADTIFGVGDEAQNWAKEMRHGLKTKADGVTRVLKSASALRRRRGLRGQAKLYHQAYRYIKTRTQWMRYHSYQRQRLPRGSGITEAACKVVFTQRL